MLKSHAPYFIPHNHPERVASSYQAITITVSSSWRRMATLDATATLNATATMHAASFVGTSCSTLQGAINSMPTIPSCNPFSQVVIDATINAGQGVVATQWLMHAISSMDTSCSTLPGASSNTPTTPSCNPSSRAADAVIVVATSAMVTSSARQRLGTDDSKRRELRLQ